MAWLTALAVALPTGALLGFLFALDWVDTPDRASATLVGTAALLAAGVVSGHLARRRLAAAGKSQGTGVAAAGLCLAYGGLALMAAAKPHRYFYDQFSQELEEAAQAVLRKQELYREEHSAIGYAATLEQLGSDGRIEALPRHRLTCTVRLMDGAAVEYSLTAERLDGTPLRSWSQEDLPSEGRRVPLAERHLELASKVSTPTRAKLAAHGSGSRLDALEAGLKNRENWARAFALLDMRTGLAGPLPSVDVRVEDFARGAVATGDFVDGAGRISLLGSAIINAFEGSGRPIGDWFVKLAAHELIHVYQRKQGPRIGPGWFIEGMAAWGGDQQAFLEGVAKPLPRLTDDLPLDQQYARGMIFFTFLDATRGRAALASFLQASVTDGRPLPAAARTAFGVEWGALLEEEHAWAENFIARRRDG